MSWQIVAMLLGSPLVLAVVVYLVMSALDLYDTDETHRLVTAQSDRLIGLTDEVETLRKTAVLGAEVMAASDAQLNKANTEFGKLHDEVLSLDERLKFLEGRPTVASPLAKPYFARK